MFVSECILLCSPQWAAEWGPEKRMVNESPVLAAHLALRQICMHALPNIAWPPDETVQEKEAFTAFIRQPVSPFYFSFIHFNLLFAR